jgi:RNA polymerase sigma factor (TIGR02999 family)
VKDHQRIAVQPSKDSTEEALVSAVRSAEQEQSPGQLFALLYKELRMLARRNLRQGGAFFTLTPTTLLHEVYLKLHGRRDIAFPNRAHFLAYASRAMRGLIIDYTRNRRALKRGGAFEFTSLQGDQHDHADDSGELQRLSDAIDQLAAIEPRLAQLVDLRYFSGFSFGDIAAMWGISLRTVQRDWEKARLFLSRELSSATETGAAAIGPRSDASKRGAVNL